MDRDSDTYNKYPIRIGYACISNQLRSYDIFTSRSLTLATANVKGIEYIQQLVLANVDDLLKILIFNEAHGIRFFRISSCVFPHLSNPKLADSDYDLNFVKNQLKAIGSYAKAHGHRLTMHPGQFIQLGSDRDEIVLQSAKDLANHVQLLQMLGYTPADNSVLIIHGGGTYGSKTETLVRWKRNFLILPSIIKSYISLENDEFSYGVDDLLPVCEELNIPFCLDLFHNKISKDRVSITKGLIKRIFKTWSRRGMVPKFHFSEQEPDLRKGAHSKTLDSLPIYLFRLPILFKTPLDIMLEVKDKDTSVFKIYYKYFNIKMDANGRITYEPKDKIKKVVFSKIKTKSKPLIE